MIAWLYSTQLFGIKLGLDNTRRLLDVLGNPERELDFIHVAGTNGKGSVCAMLAAILQETGLRTGLFTSPHLCDFRERIQINGIPVSQEATAAGLEVIKERSAAWTPSPTFFEITFALALKIFADRECDIVVLETGMGGRWDATNIVTPLVSVLTPIAMDHSRWLGDSIDKIAAEKAGIIKASVPVVSAPQQREVRNVLIKAAAERGSPLVFVDDTWEGPIGLKGFHQKANAALAAAALEVADMHVDHDAISTGLKAIHWPGRFQLWGKTLVLDGAHNPHAIRVLIQTWREHFGDRQGQVIFGGLVDKNLKEMVRELESIATDFAFVNVASPRSEQPTVLCSFTSLPSTAPESLDATVEAALASGRPTLITGSLYLVGEALAFLRSEPRPLASAQ